MLHHCSRDSIEEHIKPWDIFGSLPPPEEDDSRSSEWIEFFIKCFKIITYIATFTMMIICCVTVKSILFLMTSMIRETHQVPICHNAIDGSIDSGKSYIAKIGDNILERIVWIWCLFFILITPQLITFYRCFKTFLLRPTKFPNLKTFLIVKLIYFFYPIN